MRRLREKRSETRKISHNPKVSGSLDGLSEQAYLLPATNGNAERYNPQYFVLRTTGGIFQFMEKYDHNYDYGRCHAFSYMNILPSYVKVNDRYSQSSMIK
ncbi:hypothetical protein LTAR_02183 [Leptolinea tardivitalis]|nr:hypothetical protein LTAR_02183 [Leptolinea tardivitalis]